MPRWWVAGVFATGVASVMVATFCSLRTYVRMRRIVRHPWAGALGLPRRRDDALDPRGGERSSQQSEDAPSSLPADAWGGVCSTSPSSVVITRIPVIAIAPPSRT
jgi:hypothetical protein